eukprot:1039456-Amphidinium_carterae.1
MHDNDVKGLFIDVHNTEFGLAPEPKTCSDINMLSLTFGMSAMRTRMCERNPALAGRIDSSLR